MQTEKKTRLFQVHFRCPRSGLAIEMSRDHTKELHMVSQPMPREECEVWMANAKAVLHDPAWVATIEAEKLSLEWKMDREGRSVVCTSNSYSFEIHQLGNPIIAGGQVYPVEWHFRKLFGNDSSNDKMPVRHYVKTVEEAKSQVEEVLIGMIYKDGGDAS